MGTFLTHQCVCRGHDLAMQLAGPGPTQPTCMPTIIAQSQEEGTCSPYRGDRAPRATDSSDQGETVPEGPTKHLLSKTNVSKPGDVADISTT